MAKPLVLGEVEEAEVVRIEITVNKKSFDSDGDPEYITSADIFFSLVDAGNKEITRDRITKELDRRATKATLQQAIGNIVGELTSDINTHKEERTGKAVAIGP